MSRSCSQCGNNGHNSRTCPTEVSAGGDDGGGEKGIMLFGVRVTEASSSSFRKSASMNNLSQFNHAAHDSNPVDDGGYASDDVVHAAVRNRERKRGTPWTEDEHRLFLTGLHKVGKGDWRGISRNFVKTRTPTQVASHAQKYFLRRTNQNRRRRRSSLFDITPDSFIGTPTEEKNQLQTPLEGIMEGSERPSFSVTGITLGSVNASSSKLICPIPAPIPLPIPPSRKMAGLNLNKKTSAAPEMFPLSMNLAMQSSSSSSSSSSNEQKTRASAFEKMSNNGDSIMGVA